MNASKYIDQLLYFFYLVFFVSIICSFRAVSTIAIIAILVLSITKNKIDTGFLFNSRLKNFFIAVCVIFYLVQTTSIFYTHSTAETLKNLQMKSSLILIPLAICSSGWLDTAIRKSLMEKYVWIASITMLYCFGVAIWRYMSLNHGIEVFFYHDLVSPFKQHAVQVSIILFICLAYLMNSDHFYPNPVIHYSLRCYFIFCIIMLSSKLVISVLVIYFLYHVLTSFRRKKNSLSFTIVAITFFIIVTLLVLLTHNPVSKRFNEIISGNLNLAYREKFAPDIYFNGVQLRIVEWRFVSQILSEKKAWLRGVSTGDAQKLLDEKYIATNMYLGEPGSADHGFLGYDTHNQFLESVLQSGIFGLLAFVLICVALIILAVKRKNPELTSLVILLIAYSFTESCLESQYGLILFTFFPLFIYYGSKNESNFSE